MVRNWRLWVFVAYSVIEFAIVFTAPTTADTLLNFVMAALFLAVGQLPILLLCLVGAPALPLGVGAIIIGALGLWAYFDAIYIAPPDGQSALVFLVVPFYQLGAAVVWLILVGLVAPLILKRR